MPASDDQLANLVKSRPISLDSSSSSCFDIMSRWLNRCQLEHPKCCADITANLPTRVIDVGNAESSEPHLVETEGRRGAWVALTIVGVIQNRSQPHFKHLRSTIAVFIYQL
jgi:hypothetical protein